MRDFPGKSRVRVRIPGLTVVFFILAVLSDRTPGTLLAFSAAGVHECGHLAAMALLSVPVDTVTVYPFGADIRRKAGITSYRTDFLISGAGIAANLLTSALCAPFAGNRTVLYFLLSNLLLAALNLLPVSLLDGGCMFRSLLDAKLSAGNAARIADGVSFAFLVLLWIFSLYVLFYTASNLTLFLLCAYLFEALFLTPGRQG